MESGFAEIVPELFQRDMDMGRFVRIAIFKLEKEGSRKNNR